MVLRSSKKYVEITALGRTVEVDGVTVSIRCFLVSEPGMHYEFVLRGFGECGIVDVPVAQESELHSLSEQAAARFASAMRIRREMIP